MPSCKSAVATVAKTKELKKRYGAYAKRESVSSVLEAGSGASGSPFSAKKNHQALPLAALRAAG